MIILIFAVLTGIALIMIYLGYAIDIPVYSTVGFFLMFMLSLNLINNNIQYQSGKVETITAVNITTHVNSYATVSDTKSFGIYLAIASAVGMVLVFLNGTEYGKKMFSRGAN